MHAEAKYQQRGIRPEVVNALFEFGRVEHRMGADVYLMDRGARDVARKTIGREGYGRLSDRLNAYLVVSNDGVLIAAGKRLKRLRF